MRIYKMTATFGKLEHAALTLQPGLTVIEAPNEWGKSTWCAFLLAMVYGLDTRAKSTKTTLADKERYAPWSGSPMSGRIDLHWNGKDITIERSTRGRVPMGVFRAYETASGLEIPELTAENCGQLLLGVERSVFRQAGFIRQADMPVTKDEALLRRLNNLVTTGDETGEGDRLEKQLRELKNRCRYHRTGLLPQAEETVSRLEMQEAEMASLESQIRKLKNRLTEGKSWLRELENHRTALDFAAAEADAARVAEVRDARDRAEARFSAAEAACAGLPDRKKTEETARQLREFQRLWNEYQTELWQQPDKPELPEFPEPFRNRTEDEMRAMVAEDAKRQMQLRRAKFWMIPVLLGVALIALSIFAALEGKFLPLGAISLAAGLLCVVPGLWKYRSGRAEAAALERKYGSAHPETWRRTMEDCIHRLESYASAGRQYQFSQTELDARGEKLNTLRQQLCGVQSPEALLERCEKSLHRWEERERARQELERTEVYLRTLQSVVRTAPAPAFADTLTYSLEDTERLITDALQEQQRLLSRLGQCRGRMEALGDPESLQQDLAQARLRVKKLEELYEALTLAQETLARAQQELQRRFAPRISRRAQQLLSQMTAGRYDRLTLNGDLSLKAAAGQENVLHDAIWRSDGTVDQLYFALRLAVAEELTPDAPLVLDDAFVRFDDTRLTAALEILKQEAQHKQVILFTCQNRENRILQ